MASNVKRLTNNKYYEAKCRFRPMASGSCSAADRRQDGSLADAPDGSDEKQLTFTDDWQEGAPFYLPDNETILYRAWKRSEYGKVKPTPMTVFTIRNDGSEHITRTFDQDMNWAPYPAPDGRHYVFVRIVENNNWESSSVIWLGGEPKRLTFNPGFDGFPSMSPDGKKMLFARSTGGGLHVEPLYARDGCLVAEPRARQLEGRTGNIATDEVVARSKPRRDRQELRSMSSVRARSGATRLLAAGLLAGFSRWGRRVR
jgi:hypothetical protein